MRYTKTFRPISTVAGFACLAAITLGSASVVRADEAPNMLTDPFHIALGTFIVNSEPSIQLNGETSRGDNVNFDEALGGGDASRFRLDADWRFGDSKRHKVRALAFAMNRERTEAIDEEINWGDVTYPVNAKVDAKFEFSVIELAYEYAFWQRDNYEVNGSIGLHYTSLEASLKASSTTTGQTLNLSNEASVDAPLPVIGLRGIWKLPHNFFIDAQGQFFALSIDEYDAASRTIVSCSPGSRSRGLASALATTDSRSTWTSTPTSSTARSIGSTTGR
jgi:hypothetical protein